MTSRPNSSDHTPLFRFGVLTDLHYSDIDPIGEKFFRNSLPKLNECILQLSSTRLNFVVQLGDLIEKNIMSFDPVLIRLRSLRWQLYHVLGNRDFEVDDGDKAHVISKIGLSRRYYSFSPIQGWKCLVLDGTLISLFAHQKDSVQWRKVQAIYEAMLNANAPNAKEWNGAIDEDQISWLQRQLAEALQRGERVIVFCHFPARPVGETFTLWNSSKVLKILDESNCVSAYLSGHQHPGTYDYQNRIHHLGFHAMLETSDQNSYAIVEIYPDRLNVTGFGRQPSRVLPF